MSDQKLTPRRLARALTVAPSLGRGAKSEGRDSFRAPEPVAATVLSIFG